MDTHYINIQWTFWPFFWIIFWVCIIPLFWVLIGRGNWKYGRHGSNRAADKSPMDILKERYAKGEINKQEFEEKKKDLA
ncbi:SHOCT domain-containing protein [Pedobacter sp.]|jgi:putative membrane protein|uniref:SHOCT domain-containing protein n=1 Tax=Pedobacter sp. TaxID=1411316 RepID=UPI002BCF3DD2|nr:SHOCT domain-containing protein [Pedobacter sp.]HWW41997.1 SHOCT domain-containing protein [Pedobacter sp.]